ncbi:MAG: glycosyltransferase [Bacteroidales bacterium]|nr:glycosyltransferase [Bacteroidales bacterium]MBN2698202.1 glycosyltransferase [Bacteroidales bacterium]
MNLLELTQNTNLTVWILLGIFTVSTFIQNGYYLFVYTAVIKYKNGEKTCRGEPISVIICARNEAENLVKNLPLILEQEYPEFEVIVVNDASTDDTDLVLIELAGKYDKLRYTGIPVNDKFAHGKKLAVTIGIKAARYNHLLFTDADCYPVSRNWIRLMTCNLTPEKSIVLGYGKYENQPGMLNKLIRYETLFTAIQYLSMAIRGNPYMGVGRNLAYKRNLFFENRGFAAHYHVRSGDDDLFINEAATGTNTVVELSHRSHTTSTPHTAFRDWIRQKQRHLEAGRCYSLKSKIRISMEPISRLFFYGTLVALCIISDWIWIVLGIFMLTHLVKAIVIKLGMARLNERYLLLPSLVFEPIMPLLLAVIIFSGFFVSNNQTWK